jgi:hypothetical protein
MKSYLGTKLVRARPMTRLAYNALRGWEVPVDENPADEGYLVEYVDGGKSNHPDFKGYISWSPKDVFERAYQLCTAGHDFGWALHALKHGLKVQRAGWNSKGMWIALSCKGTREVPAQAFWAPPNREYAESNGGVATVLPVITMKTATGEILLGWLASQTDMLADDWQLVE